MRRLISIAAFALSLAVPLWAQHGGGHGGGFGGGHAAFGGGGHASGFGGHTGGFSGGNNGVHVASGGGHLSSGIHPGYSRSFSPVPSSRWSGSRGPYLHDGFHGPRFGSYGYNHRYHNGCYGYGCWNGYSYYPGFPWWYAGYYDPWWWWDSDSGYDDSYQQDLATANAMNQQSLEEQRTLRQEEANGDQDLYDKHSYARSQPATGQPEGAPVIPATVLVFRDQHRLEIQNYAIVGQTVWNFAPQRTEKIRLADLDLVATTKANDQRGITFRLPAGNQPR
jgi:hypothetical protein